MSRLKADKLIHYQAPDSWHFRIWSAVHPRRESHLFMASDEQNTAWILLYKHRLWHILMKMSHFLLWLQISLRKLISSKDLIPHWHSAFSQAVYIYFGRGRFVFHFDKGALYLMEDKKWKRIQKLTFATTTTTWAGCCSFSHQINNTNKHPHSSLAIQKSGALYRSRW